MADWTGHKGDKPTLEFWTGINITSLSRPAKAGDTVLYVYDVTGYASPDVLAIEAGIDRGEKRTVSSADATAGTITLTAALARAHPAGADVMELKAPTALVVTIIAPAGSETADEVLALGDLTQVVAGHYTYADTEMIEEGEWTVTQVATGAVAAGGRDLTLSVLETVR